MPLKFHVECNRKEWHWSKNKTRCQSILMSMGCRFGGTDGGWGGKIEFSGFEAISIAFGHFHFNYRWENSGDSRYWAASARKAPNRSFTPEHEISIKITGTS